MSSSDGSSSSSSTRKGKKGSNKKKKGKEWLDLGLGQGGSKAEPIPEPGSTQPGRANQEGELGLGLGFGDDGVRKRGGSGIGMDMVSPFASQGSSSTSLPLQPPVPPLQPSSSSCHVNHQGRKNPPSIPSSAPPYGRIPRPGPGIWFSLRDRNGGGDVSTEIPNYIRVKDDSVKVSNVKTYLVKKLGLASEAEVEITCMGQNLLPSQTLKEVRDTVWFPGLMESLSVRGTPSAGTELLKKDSMYHILTMDYQRRGSSDLEE